MSKRLHSDFHELQIQDGNSPSRSYSFDGSYKDSEPLVRSNIRRNRFSGWRGGALASIGISAFVLIVNVTVAIVAATRWNTVKGIATAFTGDCDVATRWTTTAHVIINILSSLLLGASNYCMQRLVAPTRKEIDKAHAQKKWLDVGMPSVRNLSSISKRRLVLWILLALSSVPLHFLYNSVIFRTIAANKVVFLPVTEDFLTVKQETGFVGSNQGWDKEIAQLQQTLLDGQYMNRTRFENITEAECRSRYNAQFITTGSGVGVMQLSTEELAKMRSDNVSVDYHSEGMGRALRSYPLIRNDDRKYSYCLVQRLPPPSCDIQLSPTILYIVIACNIVKVCAMIIILWRLNHANTIVTIGDAITSFLQIPDHTTTNCCLMSSRTVDRLWKAPPEVRLSQHFEGVKRKRWAVACSGRRWAVAILLYLGAITTVSILTEGAGRIDGFGKVSLENTITTNISPDAVLPHIILVNLPQAIISFIYFVYNGQLTAMLAHREWSNFAIKRAPLRVTDPSSGQRSTYYLQLPYIFSVPLLLASALLHFLISQALFLVRIVVYQDGKPVPVSDWLSGSNGTTFSALGYSLSALLASIGWGAALVVVLLALARFARYPVGLPVGGMNSAVISAACHVQEEGKYGEDISNLPLKWGVTVPGSNDTVGHCSFSSREVALPEVGHLYAGCIQRGNKAIPHPKT